MAQVRDDGDGEKTYLESGGRGIKDMFTAQRYGYFPVTMSTFLYTFTPTFILSLHFGGKVFSVNHLRGRTQGTGSFG